MNPRFLALASAALAFASAAEAAERNYTVTQFTKIRVDGGYSVKLVTGVSPFAKASGSPAALDSVSVDVQGQTLVIRRNQSAWGGYSGHGPGPVELTLGTHDLTSIWLNGGGRIAVDKVRGQTFQISVDGSGSVSVANLAVDKLQTNLEGSGSVVLGGSVADARLELDGPGEIDASALSAKNATIAAVGSAVVKATVTDTVDVRAFGTASVEVSGNPACTTRATGSATISGCR
jgi:hypothetical protein